MKNPLSHRRAGAFTLVELLTVIAIIGILAALLLPALERGKDRAKRVGCENNLSQLGLAFHGFAHEHNSKFPMQASVTEGGTLELVQNGYLVNGEFYFAFRNFQSLATELGTPKLLICPTDTRLPATNFSHLANLNLSYFVGVDADYNHPESILAGDRNLVASPGQSIYSGAGQTLRWSRTMHQFKGNLLFADGHVEESKGMSLAASAGGQNPKNDFFMPSEKPAGTTVPVVTTSQGFPPKTSPSSAPAPENSPKPNQSGEPELIAAQSQNHPRNFSSASLTTEAPQLLPTNRVAPVLVPTNIMAATGDDPEMDAENRRVAKVFRLVIRWGYMLLALAFLAWQARRQWRQWQKRQSQR